MATSRGESRDESQCRGRSLSKSKSLPCDAKAENKRRGRGNGKKKKKKKKRLGWLVFFFPLFWGAKEKRGWVGWWFLFVFFVWSFFFGAKEKRFSWGGDLGNKDFGKGKSEAWSVNKNWESRKLRFGFGFLAEKLGFCAAALKKQVGEESNDGMVRETKRGGKSGSAGSLGCWKVFVFRSFRWFSLVFPNRVFWRFSWDFLDLALFS